jgi:hypothetical protein
MHGRRAWSAHDERLLLNFHAQGISLPRISSKLNRTTGAVRVRMYALLRRQAGGRDEPDSSEEKKYLLSTT